MVNNLCIYIYIVWQATPSKYNQKGLVSSTTKNVSHWNTINIFVVGGILAQIDVKQFDQVVSPFSLCVMFYLKIKPQETFAVWFPKNPGDGNQKCSSRHYTLPHQTLPEEGVANQASTYNLITIR